MNDIHLEVILLLDGDWRICYPDRIRYFEL